MHMFFVVFHVPFLFFQCVLDFRQGLLVFPAFFSFCQFLQFFFVVPTISSLFLKAGVVLAATKGGTQRTLLYSNGKLYHGGHRPTFRVGWAGPAAPQYQCQTNQPTLVGEGDRSCFCAGGHLGLLYRKEAPRCICFFVFLCLVCFSRVCWGSVEVCSFSNVFLEFLYSFL